MERGFEINGPFVSNWCHYCSWLLKKGELLTTFETSVFISDPYPVSILSRGFDNKYLSNTLPRKIMNLPYSIPYVAYVRNTFLTADRSCATNIFEKTLIEIRSHHLYASFGTFCAQIGQFFEAQWLSESLKIDKLHPRKTSSISEFFRMFKDSLYRE